jgi:hypothetical protein
MFASWRRKFDSLQQAWRLEDLPILEFGIFSLNVSKLWLGVTRFTAPGDGQA